MIVQNIVLQNNIYNNENLFCIFQTIYNMKL